MSRALGASGRRARRPQFAGRQYWRRVAAAEVLPPSALSAPRRFVRWRRAGVWDQIMDALAAGHDAAVQMIDTSVVRVHQHGACIADNNHQDMGRSRGGLTSKIHAVWTPMACRSISLSRRVKRMTIGFVRFFSAPCFHNDLTRGSWIRRGLDQGVCPPARSMGEHSAETKSQRPDLLQPVSVSCAELDRTVLQQDQAMSACRDPVRQTRGQLSGVHQARINPNLAAR